MRDQNLVALVCFIFCQNWKILRETHCFNKFGHFCKNYSKIWSHCLQICVDTLQITKTARAQAVAGGSLKTLSSGAFKSLEIYCHLAAVEAPKC